VKVPELEDIVLVLVVLFIACVVACAVMGTIYLGVHIFT
jgi:hypothetical protein